MIFGLITFIMLSSLAFLKRMWFTCNTKHITTCKALHQPYFMQKTMLIYICVYLVTITCRLLLSIWTHFLATKCFMRAVSLATRIGATTSCLLVSLSLQETTPTLRIALQPWTFSRPPIKQAILLWLIETHGRCLEVTEKQGVLHGKLVVYNII
jgi:hypothetical protein